MAAPLIIEILHFLILDGLKSFRNRNPRNPFLGFVNINHLRNKTVELKWILREKQNFSSFPNAQFKIDGYHAVHFEEAHFLENSEIAYGKL